MCKTFIIENIFIRFGSKLYRQRIGTPMGTNFTFLIPGLFLFCYERGFMGSPSNDSPVLVPVKE